MRDSVAGPAELTGRSFITQRARRMTIEFTISAIIPATANEIYDAWLSSEGHSAMTGGEAHASPEVGAAFDAWDGYISGTTLAGEPGKRIVQSWRTSQFADDDPDSRIEITLEPATSGTRLTLTHTDVPDDGGHYEEGWKTHYIVPMQAYFDGDDH